MRLTPLTQDQCTTAIAAHSAALSEIAEGHLDEDVPSCPGWTVRDLLHHVTRVHWFWATVVEDRITERPAELQEPDPAPDREILGAFRAGADRLVRVCSEPDPHTRVWTWAPAQQDVAFVLRHQVQEIVVHHWDAAHVVGRSIDVAPEIGADCVDEMLQFSVLHADNVEYVGDAPLPPPLDGTFALRCTDSEAAWEVTDGDIPGTSRVVRESAADVDAHGVPAVTGSGGQLLLWLYGRGDDPSGDADTSAVDDAYPGLLDRFRRLCFTD